MPSPSSGRDPSSRFEYDPPTIRFGPGCVDGLADELDRLGRERALVVCGSTVGDTPAVIGPVRRGLGDRLVGVFDRTTPKKRLSTALDARERLGADGADALVAVGGGSSLDVATVAGALAASDRSREAVLGGFAETGTVTVPDADPVPVVTVPTTLAGADLSNVAGITAATDGTDGVVGGAVSDPRLMPAAAFYDPELAATTPGSVLAGSAMNGFDKGLETIYAANATPVTDATAARGLSKLATGLRAFGRDERDVETFETVLEGIVLVQYGISRPGETTLSVVHAFGHGLTRTENLQQGIAHAVVVPYVLESLLGAPGVDARPAVLADALGVADADDPDAAVVDAVIEVRDALGLPTRLRDVDGPGPDAFEDVARAVLTDPFMANAPPGYDPDVDDVVGVLERAW